MSQLEEDSSEQVELVADAMKDLDQLLKKGERK